MKRCSRCCHSKAREFFYKDKSKPDGLQAMCIECKLAARRLACGTVNPRGSAALAASFEAKALT